MDLIININYCIFKERFAMAKKNGRIGKKSKTNQVVETSNFKKNDLVFAKMRSYCAWPARIESIKNNTVRVYFFGTHDT